MFLRTAYSRDHEYIKPTLASHVSIPYLTAVLNVKSRRPFPVHHCRIASDQQPLPRVLRRNREGGGRERKERDSGQGHAKMRKASVLPSTDSTYIANQMEKRKRNGDQGSHAVVKTMGKTPLSLDTLVSR